jgi:mono/diheme cytochrome c family protein
LATLTALTLAATGLTSTLATADDAYPNKNPLADDPESIQKGLKLYFKWCVACHGKHADGVSRFGDYGADLRKFWRGYPEFVKIVLNGRTDKQMPPWGGVLDEDEISQIGAYLETLQLEGARWEGY